MKLITKMKTIIVLNIAALASIKDMAETPANSVMKITTFEINLLDLIKRYIANGILKAIDAAVIFLLPAKPLIAITLNPSFG